MKRTAIRIFAAAIFAVLSACTVNAQEFYSDNQQMNDCYKLALWTIEHNTHNNLIEAGEGYGGEWTRDCAINCWNAVSLLNPSLAENSLWSVTENGEKIGHQYWDKIIWTIGAWNHYLVTGDTMFLKKAYLCASQTMKELEDSCYDKKLGLFMGPAVFQDGIEAYEEPIFDSTKWDDSFVLHHRNSRTIKCLSTNCVYYESYRILSLMAKALKLNTRYYENRASLLKRRIYSVYYNKKKNSLFYYVDDKGRKADFQEGLGLSYAVLFGIYDGKEAKRLVNNAFRGRYGIPSVYPCFKRNSPEKPGRHNVMIWPHVDAFFAAACSRIHSDSLYFKELQAMTELAMVNGEGDFYEIYTMEGRPSGGWQCRGEWDVKKHQTWCATGYLRLINNEMFGIRLQQDGIKISNAKGMPDGSAVSLKNLHYRDMVLDVRVTGSGSKMKSCLINGVKSKTGFIPSDTKGRVEVEIVLK